MHFYLPNQNQRQPVPPPIAKHELTQTEDHKGPPEPGPAVKTAIPATPTQYTPANPNEDLDANRKIADYTQALAHYTFALVIVGAMQFSH